MNWTHRKARRSARTFTARFHPACSTAAVRARKVASTTDDVSVSRIRPVQGRRMSMTSGSASGGSGPISIPPSRASKA